jgi:hypothetical protein
MMMNIHYDTICDITEEKYERYISLADNTDKLIELKLASFGRHSLEDERNVSVSQKTS